jgi:hypothetical protein
MELTFVSCVRVGLTNNITMQNEVFVETKPVLPVRYFRRAAENLFLRAMFQLYSRAIRGKSESLG